MMDRIEFDALTRRLAGTRSRRDAVRSIAAIGAALAGARVAAAAAQEDVEAARKRCKGKPCTEDRDCGKGLYCEVSGFPFSRSTCQYRHGNEGKKGDTCCGNNQCKNNLVCDNNKCKRP